MRTPKYPVNLAEEEQIVLEQIVKNPTTAQQVVRRARIILLAGAGIKHQEIAKQLATRPNVIAHWTKHWSDRVNDPIEIRLQDSQRSGRRTTIKPSQVCELVALACETPYAHGRPTTHWTHRELADEAISQGIVETISAKTLTLTKADPAVLKKN